MAVIRQLGAVAVLMIVAGVLGVGCGGGPSGPVALKTGRSVYADHCSVCHGSRGQGGVGPTLSEVRETWPDCDDHQEWIALGSAGWKTEHGPTYGADDRPITKEMPGQAASLSPDEIAVVAAFERVEYGGGDAATELAACGVPHE